MGSIQSSERVLSNFPSRTTLRVWIPFNNSVWIPFNNGVWIPFFPFNNGVWIPFNNGVWIPFNNTIHPNALVGTVI